MVARILSMLAMTPFASLAAAYSWSFADAPRQCQDMTINITGSGGQGPYTLLIVPYGPSPLLSGVETRSVLEIPFNTSTSLTFKMTYPENSQFVAVVSDSSFGTGGTSAAIIVLPGESNDCFDPTKVVTQAWDFVLDNNSTSVIACTPTRIWWGNGTIGFPRGTLQFQGVIPGGESFVIPSDAQSDVVGQGTGFEWTPTVRPGTTFVLIGGDENGQGTGGHVEYTVANGNSSSCIDSSSPSSTPGAPAGGSYPTATETSGSPSGNNGSHSSTNIGAIVGGVVGGIVGLVFIALVLLFVLRRRKTVNERRSDLLNDGGEKGAVSGDTDRLPDNCQAVPYTPNAEHIMTSPDAGSAAGPFPRCPTADHRSLFSASTSDGGHGHPLDPTAPSVSNQGTSAVKSPTLLVLRPMNIIQHDDAGGGPVHEKPDTIELPPAYMNIKREDGPSSGEGSDVHPIDGAGSSAVGHTEVSSE